MKKLAILAFSLFTLVSQPGIAGTKTQVEYGVVQSSRIISNSNHNGTRPLRTAGAAALGAAVGNQFGGGSGKTIMTVTGAVAAAEASRNRQTREQSAQQVEISIKTQSGGLINVLQDYDGRLIFNPGDKVRILTSGSNTTVDKSV